MQCDSLQCLFCLGDERIRFEDRLRTFKSQYTLGKHVKKHLEAIDAAISISCPHPICKGKCVTVNNVQHLMNHTHAVHGIRLQTR